MSIATKRPWYAEEPTLIQIRSLGAGINDVVAEVKGNTRKEREANARLIVTAVNNHDALVDSLRVVVRMMHGWGKDASVGQTDAPCTRKARCAGCIAKDALVRVDGK